METDAISAGYDAVFAATERAPTLRRLWREHACGSDFPEEFQHISFVTLPELTRIAAELRLEPDQTLVDLACGMGGPALWLARETGARVVGVDLSPVAVTLATERAARLGLAASARFTTGTFASTPLDDRSADALVSEDALQYAPDKRAALLECARLLKPGGRFVFSAFELQRDRVANLPVFGSDPVEDYRALLEGAGFMVETYEEVAGWPEPMTRAYSALLAAKDRLTAEMGDAAGAALFSEVAMTLELKPYRRRVLACATRSQ